jgi:hypothetical protein
MIINSQKKRLAAWDALEKAGIPLEPPEYRVGLKSDAGLTIRQMELPYEESEIRELGDGRVAYVLPVFMRRDRPGKTVVREITLHVPWDDSIEWLREGEKRNRGWYTFARHIPQQYARHAVVNHRLRCTLAPGEMREGLLLGVGRVRAPEHYRDGEIIPISLSVLDQWDAELSITVKMRLNRCRYLANIARPRGPLLSKRDSIKDCEAPNPRTPSTDEEIFQDLEECMAAISAIGHARGAGQGEDES